MLRFAKRIWVLLVIVLVVVIGIFVVDRFRGFFGHTVLQNISNHRRHGGAIAFYNGWVTTILTNRKFTPTPSPA